MDSTKVPRICIISPSKALADRAEELTKGLVQSIGVYYAGLDDAPAIGKELVNNGAEILISRMGTRAKLQKSVSVPVVNIPVLLSDYLDFIQKSTNLDGFVAFFSYDSIPTDLITMCRFLNIDIRNYPFENEQEAKTRVIQAAEDGAKLFVGYSLTKKTADELKLPYVYLDSTEKSILEAIENATELLKVKDKEKTMLEEKQEQIERFKAVFRGTHEGILSIDAYGRIDTINSIAEDILDISSSEAYGRPLSDFTNNLALNDTLVSGIPKIDRLLEINGKMVVSSAVPIKVGEQKRGAVATLQYVETLQKSERKVRAALSEKVLPAKYNFYDIYGSSPAILTAMNIARHYAESLSTVLIYGETGTGKELFAQSIHRASRRRSGPFVAINCAALDQNLLESEMFGYEEGAFTGALKGGKMGLFEFAHGGTIFLDEICAMPIELQAKLLRVLQEREVRRIGSNSVIKIDVRVIAATNQDLAEAIEEGSFRRDLYYRLSVLCISIPALRDYKIIGHELFKKFAGPQYKRKAEIFDNALSYFEGYAWPGNVRELSNICECAAALITDSGDNDMFYSWLQSYITAAKMKCQTAEHQTGSLPHTVSREEILSALKANGNAVEKTAAYLGISRTTLWRLMKKYSISAEH